MYDELAYLISADPGSATTGDSDDDNGKPAPHDGLTMCKCGYFAKAILVTVDFALPNPLMPIHASTVSATAVELLLPDHFLPNTEIGPPAGVTLRVTTVSCMGWLLGTVDTVAWFRLYHVSPFLAYSKHPHLYSQSEVTQRPSLFGLKP